MPLASRSSISAPAAADLVLRPAGSSACQRFDQPLMRRHMGHASASVGNPSADPPAKGTAPGSRSWGKPLFTRDRGGGRGIRTPGGLAAPAVFKFVRGPFGVAR
jgi:hypothetical protein